ncbi:hypothetical protein IPM62_03185 [Candidatus Woesebacteria bacterium]|nr:MAG: hypothetical protein IPM62_03185 [Candidatus Woesebacteria bacterium]
MPNLNHKYEHKEVFDFKILYILIPIVLFVVVAMVFYTHTRQTKQIISTENTPQQINEQTFTSITPTINKEEIRNIEEELGEPTL